MKKPKQLENLNKTKYSSTTEYRDEECVVTNREYYYKNVDLEMTAQIDIEAVIIHLPDQRIILDHDQAEYLFTLLKEIYDAN